MSFEEFVDLPYQKKFKCREAFYENMHLLDHYLNMPGSSLSVDQKELLLGFKKCIRSEFIILKCLTQYTIFQDIQTRQFYAVLALNDPFDIFFKNFPALCQTVLLPFRNRIIYDGFIQRTGVYLGPGQTRSLKEEYRIAKEEKRVLKSIN